MISKRLHWKIYNDEMSSQFNFGHALWEPTPRSQSKRIQVGDVGFIREGCFYLLFSAGSPLGARELGVDVPSTFKQLKIREIDGGDPLESGCLCTNGVRATSSSPRVTSPGSTFTPPAAPTSESAFELTGGKGAILLTKSSIYREDARRVGTFEKYAKEHWASWVDFARKNEYGTVDPVLITGVDRTNDWAILCYSNKAEVLGCKFTASISETASVWGTWDKPGFVHAKAGPQSRLPLPGASVTASASDEYNQCVFVRYWTARTKRRRSEGPRDMKAGAGPHILPGGERDGEPGSRVEARHDSDLDSDRTSVLSDEFLDYDASSSTSADIVTRHTNAADETDDFDTIADYIFEASWELGNQEPGDSDSLILELRCPLGGDADLPTQLLEMRPQITVDENGVGMIKPQRGLPAETRHSSIPAPTISSGPGDNKHEAMIITTPPEPQSPSHHLQSTPGGTQELTTDASGPTAKFTAPVYNETMLHQPFSSSDDVLDEDGIEKASLPMGLPLGQVFSLPQDKAMRSKTPDEVLKIVSGGSQDSLSASQPHRVVAGPSARSAWAWGTGMHPHRLGTEVNQVMALVPAESLPAETDNTGTQHQTKGKRKETPGQHTSRKKRRMSWRGDILETQDLETQEHIPVGDPSQAFGVPTYPQAPTYPQEGTDAGSGRSDGYPQRNTFSSLLWTGEITLDHNEWYQPDYPIREPQLDFGGIWSIPLHLHEVDEGEGSLSHPAGIEGNQSTAPVPANSSRAEANLPENRSPNKGKQRPAQDEIGQGRNRGEKPRGSSTLESIPADPSKPLGGRPGFKAVTQTKYYPETAQKSQEHLPPVDFTVQGNAGIRLTDALNMNFSHLDGRDDLMFVEGDAGPSVSLRIDFQGHKSGSKKAKQISTMNHKKNRGPITRQKLAHDVAKIIGAHLQWASFHVVFEDMYLVRLHQVSHASWQPEVWYDVSRVVHGETFNPSR
ncbi:hypothetical protein BJ322DRAFT_1108747 [Thelephora terrestris]|uniref:Uncharacterized protein n=1 Tax=Thelephora terrestris TaxID=56493 RepID=A0A9P6L7A1_9AGAM|nr:hypothetical protein BJ322DRAFT_1108747 [Thelephora terrestris]